jgi:preprotein translocase SecE subunit
MITNFVRDIFSEVKKLQFPSKKETYITTITVLVAVVISSLVIMLADLLIAKTIGIIFGL